MPVNIPTNLPAVETLSAEGIFVMTDKRARSQDIRPLEIGIVNLMPTKIDTETQLLRLLSNTPLQIEITLLRMDNHVYKNTSKEHLDAFYQTYVDVKNKRFDGLIITGAPVETLPFDDVDYWDDLCTLMEWSKTNVYSTMHICWGAQAGLFYHYGIEKYELDEKLSGVYPHKVQVLSNCLMRGFDDVFLAPHSRYTGIHEKDVIAAGLSVLAKSNETGVYLAVNTDLKQVFITGHPEYDRMTLDGEYRRDIDKGLNIKPPVNYYEDNNSDKTPTMHWKTHAHLLFANWLNYYVYQETPYHFATT
ncbi:MAG: homoserine O-succinyltransferase [Candidatus Bathyarchaeota archaeon]|nr:homoserine O-succinyltransferase [Candidatus Termiticorpusculum sp.]